MVPEGLQAGSVAQVLGVGIPYRTAKLSVTVIHQVFLADLKRSPRLLFKEPLFKSEGDLQKVCPAFPSSSFTI